jgi:hypothetical protein
MNCVYMNLLLINTMTYHEILWPWLIDLLRFYVPLKNFSLIWKCHHCRWRAVKFRLMLGTQGLWAGRDLYRATPAVTRGLGFFSLIRRTAPFNRLLRFAKGCGRPILTLILMGTMTLTFDHENNRHLLIMVGILFVLSSWSLLFI